MSRAGWAIRQAAALDAAGAKPCPAGCGHTRGDHREAQPKHAIRHDANGQPEIVTTEHPDYKPGRFFCTVEGCDCRYES